MLRERKAVILAQSCQIPIIQDFADFVCNPLDLAQEGARTRAPLGVRALMRAEIAGYGAQSEISKKWRESEDVFELLCHAVRLAAK